MSLKVGLITFRRIPCHSLLFSLTCWQFWESCLPLVSKESFGQESKYDSTLDGIRLVKEELKRSCLLLPVWVNLLELSCQKSHFARRAALASQRELLSSSFCMLFWFYHRNFESQLLRCVMVRSHRHWKWIHQVVTVSTPLPMHHCSVICWHW